MNKKFLSMKDTIRNLKASYDTLNGAFIDYQIRSMYDLQKMYNKATYESNRRKVDSVNYESIIKDLSKIVPPEPKKSGVKVTAIIFSIYIIIVSIMSR
jgi:pyruvate/oxaloacetate carboxyltransferase